MNGDQLDLFAVPGRPVEKQVAEPVLVAQPASAELIRFPLVRRRRKIVTVAATLAARKTDQGRQAYWTKTITDLAGELRRHGADKAEIDRQLMAFREAVTVELEHRLAPSSPAPRGAA